MIMFIFSILGIIWVCIFVLSIILHVFQFIYNKHNEKIFEKKIKNNRVLETIFKTLTPDQIKKLKNGGKVEEKIDVIKKENNEDNDYLNAILDQFKEYKVGNMKNFLNELTQWIKIKTSQFNATIDDWYRIYDSDNKNDIYFTFTAFRDNVFALFAHNVDKGKAIDTITSFNKISDFENLINNSYKCVKVMKEKQ